LEAVSCDADAGIARKTWAAVLGVAQEANIKASFDILEREKSSLVAHISAANL